MLVYLGRLGTRYRVLWCRLGPADQMLLFPAAVGQPLRVPRSYAAYRRGCRATCASAEQQRASPSPQPTPSQSQASPSQASPGAVPKAAVVAALAAAPLLAADPALALQLHAEPANALSLPTWAVHTSSVMEWALAMLVIWEYAEVSGMPQWKGLTWAMMPCFFSALCACTWHFFFNSPELQWLVVLQAGLTVVGNCTCWLAAYRIYRAAQAQREKA